MTRFWLAAILAFATVRCGGVARTNNAELCIPGERAECDCAGHTKGVRICTGEGVGYGECGCSGAADGGTTPDVGGSLPPICASNSSWTGGEQGSAEMTPGQACVECHAKTPRVPLTLAGTIFPALHERDNCNGIDGLASAVALLDVDTGSEIAPRLQVNRVGNFFSTSAMPARYRVKVISQGIQSVMQAPVTSGDCNACHTAAGTNGAMGRLTKPRP